MTTDEQAIRDLIDAWARATAAKDVDAVLRLMTDDAVFLGAGRPPMRGKAAFAEGMRAWMGAVSMRSATQVQEILVDGDIATCWAQLEVGATPLDGSAPSVLRGDVLSVYRREPDGAWRLARDANLLALAS